MLITVFGLIWIGIISILFVMDIKYILYMLLLSCVFRASAVLIIGGFAITPWVLLLFFLLNAHLLVYQWDDFLSQRKQYYCFIFLQ